MIGSSGMEVIFKATALSPERISAYYAKLKPLPRKTVEFIAFLETSLRH